jgi:hypothetical protein
MRARRRTRGPPRCRRPSSLCDDSPATPAKQLSKVATDALRSSGHHAGRVASPPLPWVVGKVRRSRVRINRTTPSRRFSGASQNACIGTFPRRSASQWYVWQQTLNLKSALLKPGSDVQVQDAVWAHAQNGRTYRAASHHTLLDVKYAIAWLPASTKRPPSAIDERTALGPRGCGRAVR